MISKKTPRQPDDSNNWTRWLGLGARFVAVITLSLLAGSWLDKRLGTGMPLLIWILPLCLIAVTLYQLVKETARSNNGNKDSGA